MPEFGSECFYCSVEKMIYIFDPRTMTNLLDNAELRFYFHYFLTMFSAIGFGMATRHYPDSFHYYGLRYYVWYVPTALLSLNFFPLKKIPNDFYIVLFHGWWMWGLLILFCLIIEYFERLEVLARDTPYALILVTMPLLLFWIPIALAFFFIRPRSIEPPLVPDEV